MSDVFDLRILDGHPRLLFQVPLQPVQGTRFQPTGFPNLGAATYTLPDGKEMLLVESAQSMANRLEATAWDSVANGLVLPLRGLPHVVAYSPKGRFLTSSLLEAHRLNSPYFLDSSNGEFMAELKSELEVGQEEDPEAVDLRRAASVVFKHDPNSLLHGLFLEKLGGRYRFVRLLSSFIEASDVVLAESGGVKNDRVDPRGNAKAGYGNVPFHRTEFAARNITAYFALDLAVLRGYGLGQAAEDLMIALAIWKVQTLLAGALRLRTACDLERVSSGDIEASSPEGFMLPSAKELGDALPTLIGACSSAFASPPERKVVWSAKEAKKLSAARTKKEEAEGKEGA